MLVSPGTTWDCSYCSGEVAALQDGQKMRVVGAKAKVVDKNLRGRLFRQEPYRFALMDHPEQPVIICQRRP